MHVSIIGVLSLNEHISVHRLKVILARRVSNGLVVRLEGRCPGGGLGDEVCVDHCTDGTLIGNLVLAPRVKLACDFRERASVLLDLGRRRLRLATGTKTFGAGLVPATPGGI